MSHPKGFLFSAVEAAIKKPGRKDLALIYSEAEATMSGMFTTNSVKAAPVILDIKRIKSGVGQAIIVNSGNANACTGKKGMANAIEITNKIAKELKLKSSSVYICSTGVIGTQLPMERIISKIPELIKGLGEYTISDLACAIMTTDTFPKYITRKIKINGKTITVSGICKGAGMICPNMATMLCFLMTDAAIKQTALDRALRDAVEGSFNRITIDGDMSTNDTILIMANGMAQNNLITNDSKKEYKIFSDTISDITHELSRMIVRDGEGATKIVEIEVRNAKNEHEAKRGALTIANSLLVKTAIYGNDSNWGRIMAAIGHSGIAIKEEKIDIYLNGLKIVKNGIGTGKDSVANERLKSKEIKIIVDLKMGKKNAKVLTCDLSEDYVKINAEYRT